jgi:hypothetical protein
MPMSISTSAALSRRAVLPPWGIIPSIACLQDHQ